MNRTKSTNAQTIARRMRELRVTRRVNDATHDASRRDAQRVAIDASRIEHDAIDIERAYAIMTGEGDVA